MTSQINSLHGKKIGLLVANGFNEMQFADIQRTVMANKGIVTILSPENGLVSGVNDTGWGLNYPVTTSVSDCLSSDFDMLMVVGGQGNLTRLQKDDHTGRILRAAVDGGIPCMIVGESVSILSVLEDTSGISVATNDDNREAVTANGLTAVEGEAVVVSGSLVTGWLTAENQDLLTTVCEMISPSVEIKQAA